MQEDQVVVVARTIAEAAGASLPLPAIPLAAPASDQTRAFFAAKRASSAWAQSITRRYVTVATSYSTLKELATAFDTLVLELEDEGVPAPLQTCLDEACRIGRKLRDSFLIQANMARKSRDPQFNDLLLEQASENVESYFIDFLEALGKLAGRAPHGP